MRQIKRAVRSPLHYLAGFLAAAAVLVNWVLVLAGAGLFCLYELNEDRYLRGQAYKDVREFMVGFFIATGGLVCLQLYSVLSG